MDVSAETSQPAIGRDWAWAWRLGIKRGPAREQVRTARAESEPGAIPLHYSYVLTGTVDDYLEKLGYLDPESALAITRDFLESNELR